MSSIRFIHSSDLHLGRRFANIPEPKDGNVRGRLMEARHEAINHLAKSARDIGSVHVLLAGDTFDSSTPSPQVLRQTLATMGEHADVNWWLLPGNHDNMRNAEPIWEAIRRDAPINVHALLGTDAVELAPGVALLPCPVTVRSAGRDLTEMLPNVPTPEGVLRIGLAHGGVVDFTESGDQIPPDRDVSAGLDYLALGDWHGRLRISPRTHYPGTPEQDRFKHNQRGRCLAVSIEGRGAEPQVEEVETGAFLWATEELVLHEGEDAAAALAAILPKEKRRDTLFRLDAQGWASLAGHAALEAEGERHAPEFAYFDLKTEALGILHDVADLDEIDRAGAMRVAADTLMAEAQDENASKEARDVASAALSRLYAFVMEGRQ